jgi:hypothetical protein
MDAGRRSMVSLVSSPIRSNASALRAPTSGGPVDFDARTAHPVGRDRLPLMMDPDRTTVASGRGDQMSQALCAAAHPPATGHRRGTGDMEPPRTAHQREDARVPGRAARRLLARRRDPREPPSWTSAASAPCHREQAVGRAHDEAVRVDGLDIACQLLCTVGSAEGGTGVLCAGSSSPRTPR